MVWNNDRVPNSVFLSTQCYGWTMEMNERIPVMTTLSPAFEPIIHLVKCRWAKRRRLTNRFQCRKAGPMHGPPQLFRLWRWWWVWQSTRRMWRITTAMLKVTSTMIMRWIRNHSRAWTNIWQASEKYVHFHFNYCCSFWYLALVSLLLFFFLFSTMYVVTS